MPWITRALLCPPSAHTDDRPLVVHGSAAELPVDWPADLPPDLLAPDEGDGTGRRSSAYVLWVDEQGTLHSALRVGDARPETSYSQLRYVLREEVGLAWPPPCGVAGAAVRAVAWQMRRTTLPGPPTVWLAGPGEPAIDLDVLPAVARHDVDLRLEAEPADGRTRHGDFPVLPMMAVVVPGNLLMFSVVSRIGDIGYVISLAAMAAGVVVYRAMGRRRRRRRLDEAGVIEVKMTGAVPLSADPAGAQVLVAPDGGHEWF